MDKGLNKMASISMCRLDKPVGFMLRLDAMVIIVKLELTLLLVNLDGSQKCPVCR